MQIEALRICNLSISRCSPLALAFQGERGNNQAALIQCEGRKKKEKKEEKTLESRGRRRSGSFSQSPPSQRLSHRSNTCPHIGGSASRCYPGTASVRPCDGIPSEFFFFFFFGAALSLEISVVPS